MYQQDNASIHVSHSSKKFLIKDLPCTHGRVMMHINYEYSLSTVLSENISFDKVEAKA